jgi:hypothetical protein
MYFSKKTLFSFVFALFSLFFTTKSHAQVVKALNSPNDSIHVSIANKKAANGFLEFDIMVRATGTLGKTGNYLSSLEVELDYNSRMFAHNLADGTPTGGRIVASHGNAFAQKSKTGKKWEDSYTVAIRNVTDERIRLSLLMNYFPGAKHFRGLIDETPRAAIHIKLPLENCMAVSSGLHFVENGTITVGTYVKSIDATFGSSVRYLFHTFTDGKNEEDVNCEGGH